jgi:hypothetical protein
LIVLVCLAIEEVRARKITKLGEVEEELIVLQAICSPGVSTRNSTHRRDTATTGHPRETLAILAEFHLQSLDLGSKQAILLVGVV